MIVDADFDIVAINDLTGAEDLAYLLKYDTNHRSFHEDEITFEGDEIVICGKKRVKVYSEQDPANLPWGELGVDLVLECTGLFTSEEKASAHLKAGAKKVLISAPAKGDVKTVVYNVNHNIINSNDTIISGASCTTNCLAPVLDLINKEFGIEKGFMTTVHAYTNDQATLDIAHKKGIKSRRGRACAANIVPATTGAASAIGLVIPDLLNKLDGNAVRVPVSDGSLIDVTLELKKNTSIEEINKVFENNKSETIDITMDPVVSSDILGKKLGALVDGLSTNVIEVNGKQLVKILAWYDNEYGYTAQMLRTAKVMFK
jgi:glyceraldehyde 3-phosphate dehydrogenase